MSLEQEVELIRQFPIFAKIQPAMQKLLCFSAERLTYAPGQVMFKAGDMGDAAYIVIEGAVQISVPTPSGPIIVNTLGRNDIIGEIAILCEHRNGFRFLTREDYAGRVLWCVVVDRFCSLGRVARERLLESQLASFTRGHHHTATLAMRDEIFDRCPVRGEEKHLIARIHDRLKGAEQSLHATVHDDDVAYLRRNAISRAQFFGYGFAKFGDAG